MTSLARLARRLLWRRLGPPGFIPVAKIVVPAAWQHGIAATTAQAQRQKRPQPRRRAF